MSHPDEERGKVDEEGQRERHLGWGPLLCPLGLSGVVALPLQAQWSGKWGFFTSYKFPRMILVSSHRFLSMIII